MFIARELGKYGITVNAYAPGAVKTALSRFLFLGLNASHPRKKIFSFNSRRDESPFWPGCGFWCECSLELRDRLNPRGVLSWLRAQRLIA